LERIHREYQSRLAGALLMLGDAKVAQPDAPRVADEDEHRPPWIAQRDAPTGDGAKAEKLSVLFEEVNPDRSAQRNA
jgi:hypothetical protein